MTLNLINICRRPQMWPVSQPFALTCLPDENGLAPAYTYQAPLQADQGA